MSNINSQATVNLTVNGQQPLQVLQMLKQRAMELENAIAKAAMAGNKVELRKLRRELSDTKRQMREIETSTQQVERVMLRLDRATPKELNKTLQSLNRQLEYMERGSAAWNAHVAKIQRVKAELAKVNAELRTQESFWTRFNRKLNDWQTSLMGIAALVTGLVMAGRKAVSAFAELDTELANTRKFTGIAGDSAGVAETCQGGSCHPRRSRVAVQNGGQILPGYVLAGGEGRCGCAVYHVVLPCPVDRVKIPILRQIQERRFFGRGRTAGDPVEQSHQLSAGDSVHGTEGGCGGAVYDFGLIRGLDRIVVPGILRHIPERERVFFGMIIREGPFVEIAGGIIPVGHGGRTVNSGQKPDAVLFRGGYQTVAGRCGGAGLDSGRIGIGIR